MEAKSNSTKSYKLLYQRQAIDPPKLTLHAVKDYSEISALL